MHANTECLKLVNSNKNEMKNTPNAKNIKAQMELMYGISFIYNAP